jgi:hypothetical protein
MIEEIQDEMDALTESRRPCKECRAGKGVRVWSESVNNGEVTCTVTNRGFEHQIELQNLRPYTVDYELRSEPDERHLTYQVEKGDRWYVKPYSKGGRAEMLPPSFDKENKWDRVVNRLGGSKRLHRNGVEPKEATGETDKIRTEVSVAYFDLSNEEDLESTLPADRETVAVSISLEIEA